MNNPELYKDAHIDLYVGCTDEKVIVDFGTNLSHLEVSPDTAESIAAMLLKHARICRGVAVSH